jgi:ankyrin repeat protein
MTCVGNDLPHAKNRLPGIDMLTLREVLEEFRHYARFDEGVVITVHIHNAAGLTPLHLMAQLGDHASIKVLAQAGAEIDAIDLNGNSPLQIAIQSIQMTAISALIALGANSELRNNAGITPQAMTQADVFAWMRLLLMQENS